MKNHVFPLLVFLTCVALLVAAIGSMRIESAKKQASTERACATIGGVLVMGVEPRMQRCVKEVKP